MLWGGESFQQVTQGRLFKERCIFGDPRIPATATRFGELYQKKERIWIANRTNENSEEPGLENGSTKRDKKAGDIA